MTIDLYRHFDRDGQLLYVGVSKNAVERLNGHRSKVWFGDIAKMTIEKLASRKEALVAEQAAIFDENPIHNIIRPKYRRPIRIGPVNDHPTSLSYELERVDRTLGPNSDIPREFIHRKH